MSRNISSSSSLENLKREAKRWFRALRSGASDARARLERALKKIPDHPTLRDVQHALALEHGVSGWSELRERISASVSVSDRAQRSGEELVEWFLENACPDHHVRGTPDHIMAQHTALHVLSQHPEIARHNLYTAIVCGELDYVASILAQHPGIAKEKSGATGRERAEAGGDGDRFKKRVGPMGWEPLLYLCFTRLSLPAANNNALAMARLLLAYGADPNASFTAGGAGYTPLSGAVGEGEENRPPHPHRNALVELLLERGANAYDMQVVYNSGFSYARGEVLWFLKLIYARALAIGRKSDWDDPAWQMLDMGGYGNGARWYLDLAIKHNNLELAEWCLAHGAGANAPPARDKRFSQHSLYEQAVRSGLTQMADLLVRYGAERTVVALKGDDAFTAACMRLDRDAVMQMLAESPRLLKVSAPMILAAQQNNVGVVDFLLDLGMSPDIEESKRGRQVPLHAAAYAGSVGVVELLLQRGAKVDVFDAEHGGTPLWFAMYGQQQRVVEVLSAVSRDVWTLSLTGNVTRLREVLRAEPQLARAGEKSGETALFYLPGDDQRALEIVELFLALGTDTRVKNSDGITAAQLAEKRGLDDAARLLRDEQSSYPGGKDFASMVNHFLELACHDPILCNGPASHASRERAALRILQRFPEIARANIHTAVVCGELELVSQLLSERAELATDAGGPLRKRDRKELQKLWTPLLHLCYGRLSLASASENAVEIARLLLDHGASANEYFEVGSHPSHYSALCGVVGVGEDGAPPHPKRVELSRVLLEHGAEPFDIQVFYNTHFTGDIIWLMELIYEYSVKAGRKADWDNPEWDMIDMGGYGKGARFLLEVAVSNKNLDLAEWLLKHGANPNATPMQHGGVAQMSLYAAAVRSEQPGMAALFERYGATPSAPPELKGIEAFIAELLSDPASRHSRDPLRHSREGGNPESFNRDIVRAMALEHPEYLKSYKPIFAAAERDRADVVEFLLDLGTPIEAEDESKQRPLHIAANANAFKVAKLLIERGAELEARETNWDNTPLDHALYGNQTKMIEFLGNYSREVFRLAHIGNVERLREVLREEPWKAKEVRDSYTPLMWLPDDEENARAVVKLLLEFGADPDLKSDEGKTARDFAEERGLCGLFE